MLISFQERTEWNKRLRWVKFWCIWRDLYCLEFLSFFFPIKSQYHPSGFVWGGVGGHICNHDGIWRQMWEGVKGLISLCGTHLFFSLTLWFVWSILKSETMCTLVLVHMQIYPVSQDPNRLSLQYSRKCSLCYVTLRPGFHQSMSATIWVPPHCWADTECCIGYYFSYFFCFTSAFLQSPYPLQMKTEI